MRVMENRFFKTSARLKCSSLQSVPISVDSSSKIFYESIFKSCQISLDFSFYSLIQYFTIAVLMTFNSIALQLCLHELIYLDYCSNWIIMFLKLQ